MFSLSDVKELHQTSNLDEANSYLADGWVLITTYTYVPDEMLKNDLKLIYVLGYLD